MTDPVQATMVAVLIAGIGFFSVVSSYLNASARSALAFQSEKDGLIAALETAKSMSDEARRRAEDSNLAKSRFLATMSHELRTPLNAILGFSEVMANEVLGPLPNQTYRDYASDIHGSGHHLLNLINEILDLSRIEAGKHELIEEAVKLAHVADDCAHMLQLRAKGKDIKILTQVEPELPALWAEEKSVRQIMLNLLSNAIKFTPTGGEIRLKIGWTAGGGQYLSVSDNGPGIPEDEIPIVLSAFGQGSIAIKSAEQGTGLGLPIVQALMKMHGGTFELKSKLRVGTEVTACFPAARVMEEMPAILDGAA
jgi:two-component system cell cycle sensor histidine kinase PleC